MTEFSVENCELANLVIAGQSVDAILKHVIQKMNQTIDEKETRLKINAFSTRFKKEWKKCKRDKERFFEKHSGWMKGVMKITVLSPNKAKGRHPKSFDQSCRKTKKTKVCLFGNFL